MLKKLKELKKLKTVFKKGFISFKLLFITQTCLILLGSWLIFFEACGFHQGSTPSDTEDETTTKQDSDDSGTAKSATTSINPYTTAYSNIGIPIIDGEQVSFDISIVDHREVKLQLVSSADASQEASAWSISISGCESTYAPTFTHLSEDYFLYKTDINCAAGLVSFNIDSLDWTKLGGGACSGPVGSTCAFESGSENLSVSIAAQLTLEGITDDETVSFVIEELDKDVKETTASDVADTSGSYIYTVEGFRAPYITDLFYTYLESLDTDGRGLFTLRVECKNAIYKGHATDRTQWYCYSEYGQSMTEYDVCLVDFDDYVFPLDSDSAATVFTNCNSEKLDIAASNIKDSSDTGWSGKNGGIEVALKGPIDMYSNREMILIVKYNDSFRYWKVTVEDLDN